MNCYRCNAPATRSTKVCACGSRAFISGQRPLWPPSWVIPNPDGADDISRDMLASLAFVLGPIPHQEPGLLRLAEPHYHGRRHRSRTAAA